MKLKLFVIFGIEVLLITAAAICFASEEVVTGPAGIVQSADQYWVTFSGDCSCDDIFVMQIDGAGNVIKQPKAVLDIATYGTGASALLKLGTSKLILLHWKDSTFLARAIISKSTLKASGIKTTGLYSYESEFMEVTQNASGNFLIAEDALDGTLSAYKISKKGIPQTQASQVSPQAPMSSDEASISSDGQIVVTNRYSATSTKEKLYVQPLDNNGAPKGSPTLIAKYKDVESVDATNPLPDGNRFVVYTVDAGTVPDDRLYLQVVNPQGKKVGQKKLINTPPDRGEDSQTVAIDPKGQFVLFTMGGDQYGCPGNDILVYQALASNGKPNGTVKVLADCSLVSDDIMNLDIVQE